MKYQTHADKGLDKRDQDFSLAAVKQLRLTELYTKGVVEALRKRLAAHHADFPTLQEASQWANYHGRVQELLDILALLDPVEPKQ